MAEWRIFWFVVLPLMRPAIAALSVLIFTFIWNDYFWAIVLTQGPEAQPVTAGITSVQLAIRGAIPPDERGQHRSRLIPPVAIFFLMQRHFIAGLTLGAVK